MNRLLLLIGIITAMGTAALPARVSAQSVAPAQPAALAVELPDHPATPAPTKVDPQQFLGTAKQLLDAIPAKSLDGDGPQKQSQLREDLTNLVMKYQTRSLEASSPAVSAVIDAKNPAEDVVAWKMKFADVERDLTSILGGRGLGGVKVPDIGVKNLDPAVRTQLTQIETSVELFYDATGRTP